MQLNIFESALGLLESEDAQLRRQAIESIIEDLFFEWPAVTFGVKIGLESLQRYHFNVRGPVPTVRDEEVLSTWERQEVATLARKARKWASNFSRGNSLRRQEDFPMDSRSTGTMGKGPLIKFLTDWVEDHPEFMVGEK